MTLRHAFTVDLEDWYHGIPVTAATKAGAARRLERAVDLLLELMAEHAVRGTFYVLGPLVEQYPQLIRRIAESGHELGSHGWSHDFLYNMTPERLHEETRQSLAVIADCTGQLVKTYRAAYFSITRRSLWALTVLASLGFSSDSSVFPVHNWRYGIADFSPWPQRIETSAGAIHEFPISVRQLLGRHVPVSGGAYFRLYPYALTRSNFRAVERLGRPVVFYLHPWELDREHPRVPFHWKAWLTHYANLASTESKLRRLLREFRFATLGEVIEDEVSRGRT
jgi:polysaccharide deacetylase family protein (PEP-CTERM system associated)